MKKIFTFLTILFLFSGCHEKENSSQQATSPTHKKDSPKTDQDSSKTAKKSPEVPSTEIPIQKGGGGLYPPDKNCWDIKKPTKNLPEEPSKDIPSPKEWKVKCFKCGEIPVSEVESFGPCSACKSNKKVRHIEACSGYQHKKCGNVLQHSSELEEYFRKKEGK